MVPGAASIVLQALFAAAVWAVPAYALFAALDSAVSKKVPCAVRRIFVYFVVLTAVLAIARTALVLPALTCPPAVRASTEDFRMEPVEQTCSPSLSALLALAEGLWKSAYISLLVVLFALAGYALSGALGVRSPHLRGYLAATVAAFLFMLSLVVFPWLCAGWASSSL